VLQARVAVRPGDTPEQLAVRVQEQEHVIYPQVIGWIASGRLQWQDGAPRLDGRPLQQPMLVDAAGDQGA